MAQASVALLGLGTMGSGMAANILKAGIPLAVYNRTASKAEPFAAQGARIATSPADAARGAQIIIAMLADDAASREAWIGHDGALAAATSGTILIECSTISPDWVAELSGIAKQHNLELLDAPVTGSRVQAAGGQLTFLVGGSEAALNTASPVLAVMSKEIVYLGPTGSGAKLKLVNNFLCGVQVASLAEGIAWLEGSGLDLEKAMTVLKTGAPGSPLFTGISARMIGHDFTVNFLLKLMAKDLQYASAAAKEVGVNLTTAANALALFEQASQRGYAEVDMSAVIEPLRADRKG
jgi:3-hydroxyisobutyrate dehydrogenase